MSLFLFPFSVSNSPSLPLHLSELHLRQWKIKSSTKLSLFSGLMSSTERTSSCSRDSRKWIDVSMPLTQPRHPAVQTVQIKTRRKWTNNRKDRKNKSLGGHEVRQIDPIISVKSLSPGTTFNRVSRVLAAGDSHNDWRHVGADQMRGLRD